MADNKDAHLPVSQPVLDFSERIQESARGFAGRRQVIEAVSTWLYDPRAPQIFILTGEPGSGKSALASHLVQLSDGSVPTEVYGFSPGFLSAYHFCLYSDYRWIDPTVFSQSLSTQLSNRYEQFAKAIHVQARRTESGETSPITINVSQQIGTSSGSVTAVNITIRGLAPEDAFEQAVRGPLETMMREAGSAYLAPLLIVVDAVDEALPRREPNIVSLLARAESLTPTVRILLTSRPEPAVLRQFHRYGPEIYDLSRDPHAALDIAEYARSEAASGLLEAMLDRQLSLNMFSNIVAEKSDGNFLYAHELLATLRDRNATITADTLRAFPESLDGIYLSILDRVVRNDRNSWESSLAPVLGVLTVAQSGLTEGTLASISTVEPPTVRRTLSSVAQLFKSSADPPSERRYTFWHRSFAEFLLDGNRSEDYWLRAGPQHERLARYFIGKYDQRWTAADDYALSAAPFHLAEAAKLLEQTWEAGRREEMSRTLARLLKDQDYQNTARLVEETRGAVGGTRVLRLVDDWFGNKDEMLLAILGGPGTGKTFLSKRIARLAGVSAPSEYHNLTRGDIVVLQHGRSFTPHHMAEELAHRISSMLAMRVAGFAEALDDDISDAAGISMNPYDFRAQISRLLMFLARARRDAPIPKTLLIIDALDEFPDKHSAVDLLEMLSVASPPEVKLIITSRPEHFLEDILQRMRATVIDLTDETMFSQDDIVRYVNERLDFVEPYLRAEVASRIAQRADGNMLYVMLIVEQLREANCSTES